MPIPEGAIAAYFKSPFDWVTIAAFAFCGLCAIVFWVRRKKVRAQQGEEKHVWLLLGSIGFVVIGFVLMASRAVSPQVQFVIHRDYVACGSWRDEGKLMRVPWHYIAGMSRQRTGQIGETVVITFTLQRSYLTAAPWTDWVQSNGWVNCQIDGLTENPRSVRIPADTEEILVQARTAFRTALDRSRFGVDVVTYQDLMKRAAEGASP
jgi:hypothetical protein